MATAGAPPAPYDDGSSTESEYYYDPAEDGEAAVADAWEHESQAQETHHNQDSTVIKLECSDNDRLQQVTEDIAPPVGSEWSHGASATTVYTNAVEQALAMAREVADIQREPSTDDTMNGNTPPKAHKATYELEEGEEVESNVISLKSVNTSMPPTSITKSVATNLRRPPSEVAVPMDMEGELSAARPQWKAGQKSPREAKTTQDITKHKTRTPQQQVKSSSGRHRRFVGELAADHQYGEIAVDRHQFVVEAVLQGVQWSTTAAEIVIHRPGIIPDEAEADPLHEEDRDRDHRIDGRFQARDMFLIVMKGVHQALDIVTTLKGDRTGDPVARRRPERIIPRVIAFEAEAEAGVENEIVIALFTISTLDTITRTVMGGVCVVQAPEDLNPNRHTKPEISTLGIAGRIIFQLSEDADARKEVAVQAFSVMLVAVRVNRDVKNQCQLKHAIK
ncbi:hypothetical protein V7S43_013701 [Phytophthora oleae]|uniref:Uncharacterized protein n=1 Tax=Phytophthora oleae TaxID=2107226 RepID=A0ABD3F3M8_9STRA